METAEAARPQAEAAKNAAAKNADAAPELKAPELVCPAGSLPALKGAIDEGADCVYLGLRDATNAHTMASFTQSPPQFPGGDGNPYDPSRFRRR